MRGQDVPSGACQNRPPGGAHFPEEGIRDMAHDVLCTVLVLPSPAPQDKQARKKGGGGPKAKASFPISRGGAKQSDVIQLLRNDLTVWMCAGYAFVVNSN